MNSVERAGGDRGPVPLAESGERGPTRESAHHDDSDGARVGIAMDHHPLGPSRLEQLRLCPGAYRAQAGLPERPSDDSSQGTRIHRALETGDLVGLSDLERAAVDRFERYVDEQLIILGSPLASYRERRIERASGRWGWADRLYRLERAWLLVDCKTHRHGIDPVAVALQIADLACGVWEQSGGVPVEAYAYAIWSQEETYVGVRSDDDYSSWDRLVHEVLEAAGAGDAPRRPSVHACQYCRAVGTARCPESMEVMRRVARMPALGASEAAVAEAVAALPPESVLSAIEAARVASWAAEAVIARAKALLLSGEHESADWEVVERQGARYIDDPRAALEALMPDVSEADLLQASRLSVSKLEEVVVSRLVDLHGISKKEARAVFERLLGAALKRGAPQVVLQRRRSKIPKEVTHGQ